MEEIKTEVESAEVAAPAVEPAPVVGVKETLEALDLALVAAKVLREVLADGKISIIEMLAFLKIRSAIGPAIDGLGKVPAELKDLSPSEVSEIVAHVMAKLDVGNSKAIAIAEASLGVIAAAVKLEKAIVS